MASGLQLVVLRGMTQCSCVRLCSPVVRKPPSPLVSEASLGVFFVWAFEKALRCQPFLHSCFSLTLCLLASLHLSRVTVCKCCPVALQNQSHTVLVTAVASLLLHSCTNLKCLRVSGLRMVLSCKRILCICSKPFTHLWKCHRAVS